MQIDIQTQNFSLTDAIKVHVNERVNANLANFSTYIQKVHVHLADNNGPRHGKDDKHCMIQVDIPKLPSVVVEDNEEDLYAAVSKATQRAARAARKALERKQTLARHVDKAGLHEVAEPVSSDVDNDFEEELEEYRA